MKLFKIIMLLGFIALACVMGGIYFYRNSLLYENGRNFNEATGTVYHEQAIVVYFILFILSLIGTVIILYWLIKAKKP